MKKKTILFAVIGIVALCLIFAVFGALLDDDTPEGAASPQPVALATGTNLLADSPTVIPATPTPTSTPSETPVPAITLSPEAVLRDLLTAELGDSNRDVARLTNLEMGDPLVIDFAINDNLTEDFIRRGAMLDFVSILELLSTSNIPFSKVSISGSFPLVDVYGNSKETMVVYGLYPKETIAKINFDNFITDNIYAIAEENFIAPAFRDNQ
jgi:hypothetical protein